MQNCRNGSVIVIRRWHRNIYSWQSLQRCHWPLAVFNFVFLDCTISHFWTAQNNYILDCTNWLDCTLRISPATCTLCPCGQHCEHIDFFHTSLFHQRNGSRSKNTYNIINKENTISKHKVNMTISIVKYMTIKLQSILESSSSRITVTVTVT